jgi:hypothetical protein
MAATRTLVLLPGMDGSDKLFGPLRAAAPGGSETIAVGYPPGPNNGYDDLLPAVRAGLPTDRPFYCWVGRSPVRSRCWLRPNGRPVSAT